MSIWSEVRRMASSRHEQLAKSEHLVPAEKLLDIAEQVTGVVRKSRPEGDVSVDMAPRWTGQHPDSPWPRYSARVFV